MVAPFSVLRTYLIGSIQKRCQVMVEKSHTAAGDPAGWWPSLYEPLRGLGQRVADFFAPNAEAAATDDFYEIDMELPGVKAEDVDVSVHDNSITIKGEKRSQRQEKGRTYFFSEREYGAFQRSFRLPADVDAKNVTADFGEGVLSIRIPKAGPPPNQTRKVEVRMK